MNKAILEKYENDNAWAEVILLYSGLFDSNEERSTFIRHITSINEHLAAQCSNANITKDIELEKEIILAAESKLAMFNSRAKFETGLISFNALLELEEFEKLIPFYENCNGKQIPYLKSIIPLLLNRKLNQTSDVLMLILINNPDYYIVEIIKYFSNSTNKIEEIVYRKILLQLIRDDKAKPKHVLGFLKLESDIVIDFKKEEILKFVYKINIVEDFSFFVNKYKVELNIVDFFNKKTDKKIAHLDSYMIFSLIRKNKVYIKNHLNKFISKITSSDDNNCFVLGLILIYYFDRIYLFKNYLKLEELRIIFSIGDKNNLEIKENYVKIATRLLRKIGENNIKNDLDSFKGKILKCRIITKWKYHYVLSPGKYLLKPFLLPIRETNKTFRKGDEVTIVIIHVNNYYSRLFASQTQIEHPLDKLHINQEDLNIVNKGERINCKVSKYNDKIRVTPLGFGKSLKCILASKNTDKDLIEKQNEFIVKEVINTFLVKVLPL